MRMPESVIDVDRHDHTTDIQRGNARRGGERRFRFTENCIVTVGTVGDRCRAQAVTPFVIPGVVNGLRERSDTAQEKGQGSENELGNELHGVLLSGKLPG